MALRGTLKDFGITDIFQLIGHQQKTGSLYVANREAEAHVVFDQGSVALARYVRGHDDLRLGAMLVTARLLKEDQLETALEIHKERMQSLGDVLVAKRHISPAQLREFLSFQTKEALFRLLGWKQGTYKFLNDKFQYDKRYINPVSSEHILMDSVRMLDEWPRINSAVRSLDSCYAPTDQGKRALQFENAAAAVDDNNEGGLGTESVLDDIDAAFSEFDDDAGGTPQLDSNDDTPELTSLQRNVLGHLDGSATLHEISFVTRLGSFETGRIVADLLQLKYVTFVSKSESQAVTRTQRKAQTTNISGSIYQMLFYSILLLLLGLLIFHSDYPIMEGKEAYSNNLGRSYESTSPLEQYIDRSLENCLLNSIALFMLENSDYPDTLSSLLRNNHIGEQEIKLAKEREFFYEKRLDSFLLLSPPK